MVTLTTGPLAVNTTTGPSFQMPSSREFCELPVETLRIIFGYILQSCICFRTWVDEIVRLKLVCRRLLAIVEGMNWDYHTITIAIPVRSKFAVSQIKSILANPPSSARLNTISITCYDVPPDGISGRPVKPNDAAAFQHRFGLMTALLAHATEISRLSIISPTALFWEIIQNGLAGEGLKNLRCMSNLTALEVPFDANMANGLFDNIGNTVLSENLRELHLHGDPTWWNQLSEAEQNARSEPIASLPTLQKLSVFNIGLRRYPPVRKLVVFPADIKPEPIWPFVDLGDARAFWTAVLNVSHLQALKIASMLWEEPEYFDVRLPSGPALVQTLGTPAGQIGIRISSHPVQSFRVS